MYDLQRARLKWIESELASYHRTKKELEEIERDIIFGSDRRIKDPIDLGWRRDPTAERAIALTENRKVERLQKIVRAIEDAYSKMTDEQQKLVQLRYWSRPPLPWRDVARKMYYSERKIFMLRSEILKMIDERL